MCLHSDPAHRSGSPNARRPQEKGGPSLAAILRSWVPGSADPSSVQAGGSPTSFRWILVGGRRRWPPRTRSRVTCSSAQLLSTFIWEGEGTRSVPTRPWERRKCPGVNSQSVCTHILTHRVRTPSLPLFEASPHVRPTSALRFCTAFVLWLQAKALPLLAAAFSGLRLPALIRALSPCLSVYCRYGPEAAFGLSWGW